ncbi:DUF2786 domain-containing protein [Aldersonia sp. NBC_00410]|uniref:DUF2786 domain-containing protein n=1 Tax=Aldersonia sp. NBC_00410 TaxID=2975954 RepID=UPI0022515490|nr:DUF2786 domain-containing protein [Aldersonia sp. NBC_00410]MCX5046056.1 DUF2786 domain-containing protein [Aldersonia sp. NBC_00410]
MGKQNRRRRTGRKAVPGPRLDAATLSNDPARIAEAIATAAAASAQGDRIGVRKFIDQLADSGRPAPEVAEGAGMASSRLIANAFEFGWLPSDIHQAALRRVDKFAVAYLTDVMANHRAPFAPESVDETWQEQLDGLAATCWWDTEHEHLTQWADRALLTGHEALASVVVALALLIQLPKLGLIRPLPGTARRQPSHHVVDEKALGRVRGLLAKAESTTFGEEAESLSAKAQELMTKYAIDRVLLDAGTATADLPSARRIWLDTPYAEAKALLIDMVAHANRCRAIFVSDWGFVTVVGDDTDLDAVELLTTSLLVQATRTMIDTAAATEESRSRAYRKAFLTAYATRIGERLAATAAATIAESDPAQLLPILASHEQRVDRAFDAYFPTVRTRGITIRSADGWDAGTQAADRAHFGNH